jgi:xylulokinase
MSYYLGIDVGTYESKAVLVSRDGEILYSAARPHKMLVPQPGWAEHLPDEDWWGDFRNLARRVTSESGIDPRSIRAIGTSAIGPCLLPVDEAGNALCNGILYGVDTRAAREIRKLTDELGAERILAETGNALTSQSIGPKILWLRNNRPDLYDKAHRFVTSTTYIVHKLTGRHVMDHYSAANWNPLYSPRDESWSEAHARTIAAPDRLPELLWTTDIAGVVSPEAAEATGLVAGTPVSAGTIDAAAEAVSVGVSGPGDMMLMYGSTIFIILVTAERVDDARLWYAPWLFKGMHASMSGMATSGTLTHWFRDQLARDAAGPEAAVILAAEAAQSPPGAKGLVVLPYFSGERTPIHDPEAKGVFFGMDLTHTRADIYRALLEGIGHGTRHILETYASSGQVPVRIRGVGGGTKNQVWLQSTSNICGLPQQICKRTVGASYGDALLAAMAVGDVRADAIANWNPVERDVAPDKTLAPIYDRSYRVYRALYENTRDLMGLRL